MSIGTEVEDLTWQEGRVTREPCLLLGIAQGCGRFCEVYNVQSPFPAQLSTLQQSQYQYMYGPVHQDTAPSPRLVHLYRQAGIIQEMVQAP
jgi:hypothetical protein